MRQIFYAIGVAAQGQRKVFFGNGVAYSADAGTGARSGSAASSSVR
jgi:hypothetical protein